MRKDEGIVVVPTSGKSRSRSDVPVCQGHALLGAAPRDRDSESPGRPLDELLVYAGAVDVRTTDRGPAALAPVRPVDVRAIGCDKTGLAFNPLDEVLLYPRTVDFRPTNRHSESRFLTSG